VVVSGSAATVVAAKQSIDKVVLQRETRGTNNMVSPTDVWVKRRVAAKRFGNTRPLIIHDGATLIQRISSKASRSTKRKIIY